METILCATRGGEDSIRTQDAVIAKAKAEDARILFLYVIDVEFLKQTSRGARHDIVHKEIERMGSFLLAMACERAAVEGVDAEPVVSDGPFETALRDVALARQVDLIALGRPAGEASVFELSGLEKLANRIETETGIKTQII
jgi:nucleotide-binding universal stress UspA family protein